MKPTNILTVLSIKKAKSKEKQYKLTDGEGMFLRVYPIGSKYWKLQYCFEGKQKILSLGVWPQVSLKQAREKRYEAKKKIREAKNNGADKLHRFDENEANPRAHSLLFSSLTKIWSPFSKAPLIPLTPAGNKLFPFFIAFTAP